MSTPSEPPKIATPSATKPQPGTGEKAATLFDELKGWELVAFLGFLTYISTLAFEYGVAAYWGFPSELISFSVENAVSVFLAVAVVSALALVQFDSLRELSRPNPRSRTGREKLGLIVSGGFFALILGSLIWGAVMAGSKEVILVGGLSAILAAYAAAVLFLPPSKIEKPNIPRPLLVYLLLTSVLPWVTLVLGYGFSRITEEHLVLLGDSKTIVVRVYGTTGVCADLADDGILDRGFRLVSLTDGGKTAVVKEKVKVLPERYRATK